MELTNIKLKIINFFNEVSISGLIKEAVAYDSSLGLAIKPHLSKKARSKYHKLIYLIATKNSILFSGFLKSF